MAECEPSMRMSSVVPERGGPMTNTSRRSIGASVGIGYASKGESRKLEGRPILGTFNFQLSTFPTEVIRQDVTAVLVLVAIDAEVLPITAVRGVVVVIAVAVMHRQQV